MKKLVTALIIVLPLVLVVALFAVTGITRISADIPATGIVINNKGADGVLFFDLSDYSSPLYEDDLGIEVLPRIASNRKYSLKITDISGENPSDIVTREDSGAFTLKGVGIAKLTYTSRDGGYSDSVLFNVTTSGPLGFTPFISDASGNAIELEPAADADYQVTIKSGDYTMSGIYNPSAASPSLATYESLNDKIAYFTDTNGRFKARFSGTAILKMTVDGARGPLVKTVKVTVLPSPVTIDGYDASSENVRINAPLGAASVSFGIQSQTYLNADEISVVNPNISSFTVKPVADVAGAYIVTLNFTAAPTQPTEYACTLALGTKSYGFSIRFDDRSFSVYSPSTPNGNGEILLPVGSPSRVTVACTPYSANMRYEFSLSEQDHMRILSSQNDKCVLQADTVGYATLRIKWTELDGDGGKVASGTELRTLHSINAYTSILFTKNADSYGLSSMPAVASHRYAMDGSVEINSFASGFKAYGRDGQPASAEDITFVSSDPSVATATLENNELYINVTGNGEVKITATWKYGAQLGVAPATFDFYAVNGIEATDYISLKRTLDSGHTVVLANDIYLGENLFEQTADGARRPKYDEATMREKLLQYTGELPTTGDWQYYENIGLPKPTVRYCLDITEDIYGNGHQINADYITDMLDSTDTPYDFSLFKGPLDFVATNSEGIKLAAVKGQDNIVFLIRTDGVRVENTVLKGCDDSTLYEDGAINLSLLNNMGTTLEIMADASVTHCRIMNGRTVVRVFGRDGIDNKSEVKANDERICVNIDGCVLQNAREFLLKAGTNRMLKGDAENPSPSLMRADGSEYGAYNSPACDSYANDAYFEDNFILTDITLSDSILRTSGLFAIGMESHFAGPMLAGSDKTLFQLEGWHDLAGTSYPAILRLKGDVVLADWKDIASVDSSTLIESNSSQESLAFLSLNIAEMLKTVQQFGGDKYSDLIAKRDDEKFVHGGIAFFGGGKNYSILDVSEYTFEQMNDYTINLDILKNSSNGTIANQGLLLPLAAGPYDFRFVMFDATSSFDYDAQNKL